MQVGLKRFLDLAALVASAAALAMGCAKKEGASSATGAATGTATLTWTPNTESDLAGYKGYVGTVPGIYGPPISLGNVTTYPIPSRRCIAPESGWSTKRTANLVCFACG